MGAPIDSRRDLCTGPGTNLSLDLTWVDGPEDRNSALWGQGSGRVTYSASVVGGATAVHHRTGAAIDVVATHADSPGT